MHAVLRRRRARLAGALAFAIGLMTAADSGAAPWPDEQTKAIPCRPTIACTAEITAPGTLEAEAGGNLAEDERHHRALSFPILLKQTFTPWLQLQVGSNGYSVFRDGTPSGGKTFDNVVFGPKLHLLDQSELLPALAVTLQASVPTFAAEGERHDHAFFTGHVTKDLGRLHADFNAGAFLWRLDETTRAQGFATIALSTTIAGPFGGALETYYFGKALPGAPRDGGVRAVVNATLRPWLVLDLGGDLGYFPETRAFSVFYGMVIVPAVLWPARTRAP